MKKHYERIGDKMVIVIKDEMFKNINRVGRYLVTMLVEHTEYLMKLNVKEVDDKKVISVCCPLCDELTTQLYMKPFDSTPDSKNIPLCAGCYEQRVLPAR